MNNIYYMKIALKEAKKASSQNEVPIGCIIVKNNKIIAKAHNKKEKTKKITDHAEILAINKACKKLKTWHLNDCIMYTTVEPCLMCSGAIIQSHINIIYCAAKNEKFGELNNINKYLKKMTINYGILEKESIELLQKFFIKKRK